MLNDPISSLPGIAKQRSYFFAKMGVVKNRDLLFFLPFKHLKTFDYFLEGEILIKIKIVQKLKLSSRFFKIFAVKNEQKICINCFNIKFFNIFQIGQEYLIYGTVYLKDGCFNIDSPSIMNAFGEVVPIYKCGSNFLIRKLVDPLIQSLDDHELIHKDYTLRKIFQNLHDGIDYKEALIALKYLEASFLVFLFKKAKNQCLLDVSLKAVLSSFPYALSDEQNMVCSKIECSLKSGIPLKYFVYGEVGAGKTIVSIVAALMVINAGYNVVFLAPTVTLAYQHYYELLKVIPEYESEILLLTSLSKKKKQLKEDIIKKKYRVIVGTHALMFLEEIPKLGLIIIDEIHKFGVLQKSKLLSKAELNNVLMLTATPIPRSLYMILNHLMSYDTLPSFKPKNTKTIWIKTANIESLISKLQNKKVYWVLPNIEESDKNQGIENRRNFLSDLGLITLMLHGKMKDAEKLSMIDAFKAMSSGVLVATTIIEIGINIPDADIIVIENAECFGLSQLHQLRGRVGRLGQESYCILLSEFETKKIRYMKQYASGFDISNKDLELRGGGKLTGFLQHGCDSFYFLDENDTDIFDDVVKNPKVFEGFNIFSECDIFC